MAWIRARLIFLLIFSLIWTPLTQLALAGSLMDQRFSLRSVGVLQAGDAVDGAFAPYFYEGFRLFFDKQSRFEFKDLSGAEPLLDRSGLSRSAVMEDLDILRGISKKFDVESMIRCRSVRKGSRLVVQMDWVVPPDFDRISQTEFTLTELRRGEGVSPESIHAAIANGVEQLIAHIPFVGHVTGVGSNGEVVLHSDHRQSIRAGDRLYIASLSSIRSHPLLKTVVDWNLDPVGAIDVDTVDRSSVFGHVAELSGLRKIEPYHKITIVKSMDLHSSARSEKEIFLKPTDDAETMHGSPNHESSEPSWAEFGLSVPLGLTWSKYSLDQDSTSVGTSGFGFLFGAGAHGSVFVYRDLVAAAAIDLRLSTFSVSTLSGQAVDASPSLGTSTSVQANVGWRFRLPVSIDLELSPFLGFSSLEAMFVGNGSTTVSTIAVAGLDLGLRAQGKLDRNVLLFGEFSGVVFPGGLKGTFSDYQSSSLVRLGVGAKYFFGDMRLFGRGDLHLLGMSATSQSLQATTLQLKAGVEWTL